MPMTRRQFLGSGTASLLGSSLLGRLGHAAPTTPAAFDPHDWASVRAQFLLSPDDAHLSNFFFASMPAPVRAALAKHRQGFDENPYSYLEDRMFAREEDMLWRKVCAAAADYIGGHADEIALTSSTTVGLALIYNGLRLRPGQEILTTTHDFYPHHEAIRLAVEKWGGSMRKVALYEDSATVSADQLVARLRTAIQPQTRIVGLTWVHSGTGVRLPIRAMAEVIAEANRGRDEEDRMLLVVDGVHGFGAVDAKVAELGGDFFCSGTHKWMLGPHGTGLIWAKPAHWALLRPTIPSLMDQELVLAWREERPPRGPTQAAWVSPGGFFAYEHQWATIEAFHFHQRLGRPRVAERIAVLNGRIKQGLASMRHVSLKTPADRQLSAGIVCFEVAGHSPQAVVDALRQRRVIASSTPYATSYARLSAGIVNSEQDVDQALTAIRALA